MKNDDLLGEIRAVREQFAREHRFDVRAMAAALRELDLAAGTRVIRREPRTPMLKTEPASDGPNHARSSTAAS